ncbi:cell wall hydrolase [Candidatus Saccharibacteria bacterium]|nr:cell wall hydrolase [Candidatus Saccharibacteria bacterium]
MKNNERLMIAARLFLVVILAIILAAAGSCLRSAKAATGTEPPELFSVDDILLLAAAMELENGCNSDLCLLYTGSVIINRVNSPRFPDTIYGVLHQKGQYAAWTLRHLDTVKISERTLSLALKLAMCGSLDTEIIFQSMHPELGRVKYHIDTEYFATE